MYKTNPGDQINWARIESRRKINGIIYRLCSGEDYHLIYAEGDLVDMNDGKGWRPCPEVLLMEDLKPSEQLLRPESNMGCCSRA